MSNSATPTRFRDIFSIVAFVLGPVVFGIGIGDAVAAVPQGPVVGQPNDNTPKPGIFLQGAMRYGRIVDIWALDADNTPVPITKKQGLNTISDPTYLDTVIGEAIGISKTSTSSLSPPVSLVLQRDSISGATALVIGTQFNKSPKSAFQIALKEATNAFGTIAMGGPTSLGPFSQVPRDAAIVLNFDRPVNPKTIGPETIQLFVGSSTSQGNLPPTPFSGRYIWKAEQPKTVVIDTTINAVDDARIEDAIDNYNLNPKKFPKQNPQVLPVNTLGLPASITSTTFNVAVFIPSSYNIIGGITKIILGRDGTALDINKSNTKYIFHPSGQQSGDGITGVARVFRAGNSSDANQGFLTDPSSPAILGTQQVVVTSVGNVAPNDGRLITFHYVNEPCSLSVRVGDSLQQGSAFATVATVDPNSLTDGDPGFTVAVNYLQSTKFNIVDPALITTPFTEALGSKAGCFVLMQPTPDVLTTPTLSNIDPQVIFTVRFSKPMQLAKVDPLRTVAILLNPAKSQPLLATTFELAVGNIIPSPDLRSFRYVPFIPLPHTSGTPELYKLVLMSGATGLIDLTGNPLTISATAFTVPFTIKQTAPSNKSRFFHMKFDSLFEAQPAMQISGQVTKSGSNTVSGRPVTHFSRDLDQSNTMINAMVLFAQGIQTPLSALGSRLQTVYRNVDCNLSINQLSDIDLDIEGLYWAPFAGLLNVSDFFEHIRIDLAHSQFAPDEFINAAQNLPMWTQSGLSTQSFASNNFDAITHPPRIVYEGVYNVSQNALFATTSGTNLMPWPKFTTTYTWRDSTYGSKKFGAPSGNGVNPDQYFSLLNLPIPSGGGHAEKPYAAGSVPSVGLPLLMDFRIYPADDPNTKGLNGFLVTIAVTSSSLPSFRVFSTGGLDTNQSPKTVVPDVGTPGTIPSGGYFPPGSTQGTPGTKTSAQGPEVYIGRADFAVKNSHAFTHFYNFTSTVTPPIINIPAFQNTNTIILPTVQPANTSISVAYRGAVTASAAGATLDARCFDAYGDQYTVALPTISPTIPQPSVTGCGVPPTSLFPDPLSATINFTPDISLVNGKSFIQMRFSFKSDIINNVAPSMNGFGIAYSGQ